MTTDDYRVTTDEYEAESIRHALVVLLIDTQGAYLEVHKDDGPYRHLRFNRDDTGLYWINVYTAPNLLTVHSDHGAFVFGAAPDPFAQLDLPTTLEINPRYWGDRVRSADREQLREYDKELFLHIAREMIDRYAETWGANAEQDPGELRNELALADDPGGNFETEDGARELLREWEHRGICGDTQDLDLTTWSYRYLRALWTVKWAAVQYLDQRGYQRPDGTEIPIVPRRAVP